MFSQYAEYGIKRPRMPAKYQPQDDTKIYLHTGESKNAYQRFIDLLSYLQELEKFLPGFEQDGYKDGTTYRGKEDGIGSWPDQTMTGVNNRGNIGPKGEPRYGDFHDVSRKQSMGEYGSYEAPWGYGLGSTAQNLDFSPAAYDFWHLDSEGNPSSGYYDPVDAAKYGSSLYSSASGIKTTAGDIARINSAELKAAQDYLKAYYGDKSYYQIALAGIDDASFSMAPGREGYEWNLKYDKYDVSKCKFLYEGKESAGGVAGQGAYYLMLAQLESRRRINSGMMEIFGSPFLINNSDNQQIIAQTDKLFNQDLAGLSSANMQILSLSLAQQHKYRSVAPAYSANSSLEIGDLGSPGYVYTVKDIVALAEFRAWMNKNLDVYRAGLSPAEQARFDSLRKEWDYTYEQPYGTPDSHAYANYSDYIGWDRFSLEFKLNDPSALPNGSNPLAQYSKYAGHHENYAIVQLSGLDDSQIMGLNPFFYQGNYYNLFSTNWVVHFEGMMTKARKKTEMEAANTIALGQHEKSRYRREKAEAERKLEEAQDEKREEQIAENRANGMSMAGSKKAEQKSAQKQAENKAEFERSLQRMRNKIIQSMLARNKKKSRDEDKG